MLLHLFAPRSASSSGSVLAATLSLFTLSLATLAFDTVDPRVIASAQEAKPAGGDAKAAGKPVEAEPKFTDEQIAFFEKQVQPILKARCLKCHGGEEKIRGDFRMTSRGAVLRGGELGPAVSLEKPETSSLIKAINYAELEMPPSGKLPAAEVEILTKWVKDGLPWTPGVVDDPHPVKKSRGGVVDAEARKYWAYQPIKRPEPPKTPGVATTAHPIDAFLLAKIHAAGLKPVAPADPATLIRRVYFDLTGLPPSPAEVDAFVADPSPAAYEKMIDRLLDSPQYGEKWGRIWLDLVRYAETNGYERDNPKPAAWRYRDYVVQSFNADKPYDRFLMEQLAGDELDEPTTESIVATGYYRLGIWDDEPADRPLAKYDVLDGIVSTTGQVVLGMSVGCARCHDHKKDPLPHRDYYRLLAFFRDVSDMNGRNTRHIATPADQVEHAKRLAEKSAAEGRMYGEIYAIEQQYRAEYAKSTGRPLDDLPASDLTDLHYRFYRDTWNSLPEFDQLKHEAAGAIANNFISLAPASRDNAIGLVWEAKLKVPADGEYRFDGDGTEGFKLTVGGQVVLDRPQLGHQKGDGKIKLKAGLIPLRLDWFNSVQKPSIELTWTLPTGETRSLTESGQSQAARTFVADSREKPRRWQYTTEKPADDWTKLAFDDAAWKRGPGGFGQQGTPGAVVRTPWNSQNIWLRTKFTLKDSQDLPRGLTLNVHHDEDVEVYLNGVRVYAATGFLRDYTQVALDAAALQALQVGENVLAVHCRQTGGGQYIDVGLTDGRARIDVARQIRDQGAKLLGDDTAKRYVALVKQLEESRKAKPEEPGAEVMCVTESGRSETNVLLRGNPHALGEKVQPGVPAVLSEDPNAVLPAAVLKGPAASASSGKRRALAEWLTSKQNPLTARVMANRLWQNHFGIGIVPTPNDFGQLGEQPSHPELLDWLASELMAGDWRLKRMHKLIMLTDAYRRSSHGDAAALEKDPANHLLWRYNMRRLTAEEVRDTVLAASGQLNLKPGGPSIYPPIPREVLAGQSRPGAGWGNSPPEEASRRSIYIHVKRSLLVPILSDHDVADTDSSCPVRYVTTVPTQSLGMLNGDFTNEQARKMVERLKRERPGDLDQQIRWAVRLTTGRSPTDAEVAADRKMIVDLREKHKLSDDAALAQFCLLCINANEFIYLD